MELYILHFFFTQNKISPAKPSLGCFHISILVRFSSVYSISLENPVSNCSFHAYEHSLLTAYSLTDLFFWPSYQRCRNYNESNSNEKTVFLHLIYLQRLNTLCVKRMSSSFSKNNFNMFTIVDIMHFWKHRIWTPALSWYIIKMGINPFPPKSSPLLLLRFSTFFAFHMADLSER